MCFALFKYRVLQWWCFVFAWMTLCTFYILVYTSACGEAACDELWFFMWLSLLTPALLWWLSVCQRYKTDHNSRVLLNLVVYIQMSLFENYSLILYILLFSSVNMFTVFLYFLQNYSGNHSCQKYFVKTTAFYLQCRWTPDHEWFAQT